MKDLSVPQKWKKSLRFSPEMTLSKVSRSCCRKRLGLSPLGGRTKYLRMRLICFGEEWTELMLPMQFDISLAREESAVRLNILRSCCGSRDYHQG